MTSTFQRWKIKENELSRKRTEKSFLVPLDEIKDNDWDLSINRYKEIVYETFQYDTPSEIWGLILKLWMKKEIMH